MKWNAMVEGLAISLVEENAAEYCEIVASALLVPDSSCQQEDLDDDGELVDDVVEVLLHCGGDEQARRIVALALAAKARPAQVAGAELVQDEFLAVDSRALLTLISVLSTELYCFQ